MVPNQLHLTRLAHAIHDERTQSATAHPSYDDESYLRPQATEPRPQPRSLVARLLGIATAARAHRMAGQPS